MTRFVEPPDDVTAAEIGRRLVESLSGSDPFALGRLRKALIDHFGTEDVWATDDQRRVILAVLDGKQWFAGPPWLARPYDPADPTNPQAAAVEESR